MITISSHFARWVVGMARAIFNNGTAADWDPLHDLEDPHFRNEQGIADRIIIEGDPNQTEWVNQVLLLARTVAGVLAYLLDNEMIGDDENFPIELDELTQSDEI